MGSLSTGLTGLAVSIELAGAALCRGAVGTSGADRSQALPRSHVEGVWRELRVSPGYQLAAADGPASSDRTTQPTTFNVYGTSGVASITASFPNNKDSIMKNCPTWRGMKIWIS